MSDADDAAEALENFVPISVDDPRVQEFRDAVLDDIGAVRPSHADPPVTLEDILTRLDQIESAVREILSLLARSAVFSGGPP